MGRNKKSQQIDIFLSICLLILLIGLFGGSLWNGDRNGYEDFYNNRLSIDQWGTEIGYGLLNIVFNKIGVSYQYFQLIISIISMCLVFRYLSRVSTVFFISILFYAVFMLPLDYVLIRTTIAYAIILNSLIYLYKGEKVKFFILVLIAFTFHQSSIIFAFLGFLPKDFKTVKLSRYLNGSFLLVLVFLLIKNFNLLPNNIIEHLNYYKPSIKSVIFSTFLHGLSVFFILYDTNIRLNSNESFSHKKYISFIKAINILSVLLIPLYFQADIFVRVFRLFVFINIIYLLQMMLETKKISLYALSYIVIFSFYLFFYYIYLTANYSIYPMINSNFLYEYLIG
ncbi:EpsG family protein [Photobacterium iliopiscarium]|uniref:EpsG family protein n=1 Tax=Photobacterium iliopiscarium TaxID=56192 RepID=UPI00242E07F7|nr:EpsG family protein [Photobacterium iliopiscarium]